MRDAEVLAAKLEAVDGLDRHDLTPELLGRAELARVERVVDWVVL